MLPYILVQLGFNLLLLVAFFFVYRKAKAPAPVEDDERISVMLAMVKDRLAGWEIDAKKRKELTEVELRKLVRVCDKATQLLNRAQMKTVAMIPTEEEEELKKWLQSSNEEIPSVKKIETKTKRPNGEIGVDLRSILRDQLA